MARFRLRALRHPVVVGVVEGNGFEFARRAPHGDIYRRASDARWTTIPRRKLDPAMLEVIRKETGKREDEFIAP